MSDVQCVSFPNRQGMTLHGILHAPDADKARGVCILLLSPGIKGRVAPHRLHLKMAERLVPMGFHVLRFDFHGLGDSEGRIDEPMLFSMYQSIQLGRYVDDTIDAMDWMRDSLGICRFIGSGLCGGSITALLTAGRDRRIEALLGIGIPTALELGPQRSDQFLSQGQLEREGQRYVRNVLDPKAWGRFLTGKSGYKLIFRSVAQVFLPKGSAAIGLRSKAQTSEPSDAPVDNAIPGFAPAFLTLLQRGAPILLVFSGNDRLQFEFSEKFEQRHMQAIAATGHNYETHLVEKANHILSDPQWLGEMLDVATAWLERTRQISN